LNRKGEELLLRIRGGKRIQEEVFCAGEGKQKLTFTPQGLTPALKKKKF